MIGKSLFEFIKVQSLWRAVNGPLVWSLIDWSFVLAAEESSEAKCSSARTSATSVGGELVLGRASAASFVMDLSHAVLFLDILFEPLLADFQDAKAKRSLLAIAPGGSFLAT